MSSRLGYIYACVAGDHRYSSRIEVLLNDDESVNVEFAETAPVGGMDGPGGRYDYEVREIKIVPKNPHSIVKAIKELIKKESPQVIAKYGKPTKRFRFVGAEKPGINVHACKQALGIDD